MEGIKKSKILLNSTLNIVTNQVFYPLNINKTHYNTHKTYSIPYHFLGEGGGGNWGIFWGMPPMFPRNAATGIRGIHTPRPR